MNGIAPEGKQSTSLPVLDETLKEVAAQVWNAIGQLPALRGDVYVSDDNDAPLYPSPSDADLSLFRQQAIPGPARPVNKVIREAQGIFTARVNASHPRFLAAIPSAATPLSWLGETLASAFNAYSGAWRGGPGVATIEIELIAWLAAQVGLPRTAGGTFVSGGSIANLTAMAVARDQRLKAEERPRGVAYFSDQTHFCVPKTLRLLGFFDSQMRVIPSDANFCMDMEALEKAIIADEARGLVPFVVIANHGTTNTGAIDPLDQIADFAQAHGLWMHVDGAYGASVALSRSHRSLCKGLERADSIAWDAHKWLFQTFGCAMILVRNKLHLAQSFTQTAEYLRDAIEGDDTPNLFNYGIELTKPARHMKLWFSLRVLGTETYGRMIDHGFVLARTAEAELRTLPGWEITSPVTLSAVTFRYVPVGKEKTDHEIDVLNSTIAEEALLLNVALMLTTQLKGRVSIRICANSPQMSTDNMQQLIHQVDDIARRLAG